MKRLLILSLLLAGCNHATVPSHPADATQSEINMAEMMQISVEELRQQTPEEHRKMMKDMMKN